MTDLTDEVLVDRAQQELPYNSRSYQLLMQRYQPYLYRLIYASLKDADESHDVLQEVLVRVYKSLPGFKKESAFKTWLTAIAINRCNTRHDKIKREARFKELWSREAADSYEHGFEDESDEFGRLIDGLNYQERQILSLRFVAEMELKDIAEIAGLKLSACKMKFYRSLEKIKARQASESQQ